MVSLSSPPFSVTRKRTELISPSNPTPREVKQLSDIDDQGSNRFQLPLLFFYENENTFSKTNIEKRDRVEVIKEAIARALVFYYPLAGRLMEEPNGELTMDCTAEGVLFVEADTDVSLQELGDRILPPCPLLEEFLCDASGSAKIVDGSLLMIQVTRLSCGGIVLAVQVNHTVADSLGVVKFLITVAELARGSVTPTQSPVWQREFFNARFPPIITHRHNQYENVATINPNAGDELIQESIVFGEKEISSISKHLPPFFRSCSTGDLVMACVWKARTMALQLDPSEVVRLTFMVDARGTKGISLPPGYYGNSFVSTSAISKSENLCKSPLEFVLGLVKNARAQVTKEYIRSLSDFLAVKGRPNYSTTANFIVYDTTRIAFEEVDFGWGRPVYCGPVGVISSFNSPLVHFRSTEGEEKIIMPICLPVFAMERFKKEVRNIVDEPIGTFYGYEATKAISKL